MTKEEYSLLEQYMLSCMGDSAHDKEHIYRVLYQALDIGNTEDNVNFDVLIAACLLHDIGRKEQFENPSLCHAMVGGNKAWDFLMANGFAPDFARQVKHCIQTHRYRKDNRPQSLEAKILFDADKLDVTGAMGIARTLIYKGIVSQPIYSLLPDGTISDGQDDEAPSFFQEYKYKLENLYTNFYTARARDMARERQGAAVAFYNCLYREASSSYEVGRGELRKRISEKYT